MHAVPHSLGKATVGELTKSILKRRTAPRIQQFREQRSGSEASVAKMS